MRRILHCVPVYEGMKPSPLFRTMLLMKQIAMSEATGLYKHKPMVVGPRSAIRRVRNHAVKLAIEMDATHLLFQDDDTCPPSDALDRLIEDDKPIVGGLVRRRDGAPCVFKEDGQGSEDAWIDCPQNELFPAWAIGTGFILISVEVLKGMGAPWFYFERTNRTMDVNFCRAVQAMGVGVWCDSRVVVPQLTHQEQLV